MSLPNILEQLAGLLVAQQEQIAALEGQLQAQEQAIASLAPLLSLVPVAERSSLGRRHGTSRIGCAVGQWRGNDTARPMAWGT